MTRIRKQLKPGDVFTLKHPFVLEEDRDAEGNLECTWRPGVLHEDGGDTLVCNGEGTQVLQVISLHRPGAFRTRVFYTRQFIDPSGAPVSKPKLRVCGTGPFQSLTAGYRHAYEIDEPTERAQAVLAATKRGELRRATE